jgi:hypothetical protein
VNGIEDRHAILRGLAALRQAGPRHAQDVCKEDIMKVWRVVLMGLVTAMVLLLAADGRADTWDKKTVIKVSEAVQIPGAVLVPGTYVFKLLESPANRHIVQVTNEDETKVITTFIAIPNYRLAPTGETALSFWEVPKGFPAALRAWFYPGDNFGQEFAYPAKEAARIAAATATTPPVAEVVPRADLPLEIPLPPTEPEVTPAEPALEPQAEAPPVAAPEPEIAAPELPRTASPLPLIGLAGLMFFAGGIAVRLLRTSLS